MEVGGYTHNYEGFCENVSYPMSINREIIIITQVAYASLLKNLSFLLSLLTMSVEEQL